MDGTLIVLDGARKTQTQIVVAIAGRVPVAIRRTTVPGVVVPTAATVDAVRTRTRTSVSTPPTAL